MEKQSIQVKRRHAVFYKILRAAVRPFAKWKFRYVSEAIKGLPQPFLVLANHVTDFDPVLVGASFRQHMYFVASEHVFRWGMATRLIEYMFAPIPRLKGATDARTVRETLQFARRGENVCIFAEGERTYDGVTMDILPSTGKLALKMGATLVTFRIEGGYLTSPRWGKKLRKGRMAGHIVGQYAPGELKAMNADEVNTLIKRDLYENAEERQAENPIRYRGPDLAENLEIALYMCPGCHRIGTLRSEGERLFCRQCGHSTVYTECGALEGGAYASIAAWSAWQEAELIRLLENAGDGVLFSDDDQQLYRLEPCVKSELMETGRLSFCRDALRLGAYAFGIEEIADMAVTGKMTITFSTMDGAYYELKSPHPRSPIKYVTAYKTRKRMN